MNSRIASLPAGPQRDEAYLSDVTLWPNWPFAPLKHTTQRDSTGFPVLGVVLAGDAKPTVYVTCMFGITQQALQECERREYETLAALLADGWTVD